jgi:hypothetical protein
MAAFLRVSAEAGDEAAASPRGGLSGVWGEGRGYLAGQDARPIILALPR